MKKFYTIIKNNEQNFGLPGFRKGKAKGAEYDNVFVIGNEGFLNLLLNSDIIQNEEHRIFYVALSRAKKRLFLQLDELSEEDEDKIKEKYSIDIERI